MTQFILILSCPDRPGIVAAVSEFLVSQNMNITQSNQFGASETNCFFMRIGFDSVSKSGGSKNEGSAPKLTYLQQVFEKIAVKFNMEWQIYDTAIKPKALILVSKFDHCLVDLLYRARVNALNIDVAGVFSNHEDTRHLVEREGIPFHVQSVSSDQPKSKAQAEQKLHELIKATGTQVIILARYMQVLSAAFSESYAAQIINIHHSFLPSFKGAVPYSRAFERGVKMIGATAHYVTGDLDEGPIIAQNVAPVRHDMSVAKMVTVGREVEQHVLAEAVSLHCERRVLINGNKTVAFNN